MNVQSETSSPGAANNPQPETSSPPAAGKQRSRRRNPKLDGRPRRLDDAKRQIVCAMISSGCGLRDAARYVQCSVRTIRREAERNPAFDNELRRSEVHAKLSPLRAMQHAISTHWRAAAWFLERAFPERFAKPERGAFGARQARQLLEEVLRIFSSEVADAVHYDRVERRVRATFEYYVRTACDRRRNARALHKAMSFFEAKDEHDPLAAFGFRSPDFSELFKPTRTASPNTAQTPREPAAHNAPSAEQPDDAIHAGGEAFSNLLRGLANELAARDEALPAMQPSPADF